IEKDVIEALAPVDVGDLLQKLPGTTIRSYGAIGALKTISFNGMGAQHSAVLIDGFLTQNLLAGQVNLSQIQVEGISSVSLEDDQLKNRLLPVKSRLSGTTLLLGSGLLYKSRKKGTELNINLGVGSFNTYDGGMRFKQSTDRSFLSAFGYYRRSNGDFFYTRNNGAHSSIERRNNNQFEEKVASIAGGIDFSKKWSGRLRLSGKKIDQELPGAIILYNDYRDERMSTDEMSADLDVAYHGNSNFVRSYYSGLLRETEYLDPSYLNQNGFLRNVYREQGHTLGYSSFHVFNRSKLETGVSVGLETLFTDGVDFNDPLRMTIAGFSRYEHHIGSWETHYQLGAYIVSQQQESRRNYQRLMPRVKFFRAGASWLNSFELSNTYRLPSFNELYFGGIGNPDLLPENAYQFKYSLTKSIKKGRMRTVFDLWLNSSYVDNKIVAVPTKNMFIWSIQNIHKTLAGSVVFANNTTVELKGVDLYATFNYQLQSVLDISNSESPTYLHQIAYVPNHTGSIDLGVKLRGIQLNVSNYLVGFRYVLNENNYDNLEDGYFISDISLKYTLIDNQKHTLSLQGVIKNIFDTQYAFIRGFVMPGRNYLIKLRYGLN
ncbi:MAG: TonB-dependent receptor plug domain-containing protein, partial [Crocinitomicaceae bacterium]